MQLDFLLSREVSRGLQTGAVMVPSEAAIFEIQGPGAIDCLQGLLTNDIVAAGENSLSYGGILTSKGMILLDPLVNRIEGGVLLVLPASAREVALGHFARVLPPRLARVRDRSGEWTAAWLMGAKAEHLLHDLAAEQSVPGSGHLTRWADDLLLARGTAVMPFDFLVMGGAAPMQSWTARLGARGAIPGDQASLALARVLAGWPALGAEIDEKTLPQEVRYDELGAVSYSKGCYTGQETVARVHFRGHANRYLRGAVLPPVAIGENRTLFLEDREVGVLRTTVRSEDRVLAMATVRREVPPDGVLRGEAGEVRLVPFPVTEAVAP